MRITPHSTQLTTTLRTWEATELRLLRERVAPSKMVKVTSRASLSCWSCGPSLPGPLNWHCLNDRRSAARWPVCYALGNGSRAQCLRARQEITIPPFGELWYPIVDMMGGEPAIEHRFKLLENHLDERQRRLVAAAEAEALGLRSISLVSRSTGVSRRAIRQGLKELQEAAPTRSEHRIRRPGGGRKKATDKDPTLRADLERLVESSTRGDPESPLLWVCKSVRQLAKELQQQGHQVSHQLVSELLHELGYSLQANRKVVEGSQHPDRDAQFEHINRQTRLFRTFVIEEEHGSRVIALRESQVIFDRRGAAAMASRKLSVLIPGPGFGRSSRTRSRRPSPWLWMSKKSPGLAAGRTTRCFASTVEVSMLELSHQIQARTTSEGGHSRSVPQRPHAPYPTSTSSSFRGARRQPSRPPAQARPSWDGNLPPSSLTQTPPLLRALAPAPEELTRPPLRPGAPPSPQPP